MLEFILFLFFVFSCTGQVTLENAGNVALTKLDIKLKKPRGNLFR